jgi:hypothetical protein
LVLSVDGVFRLVAIAAGFAPASVSAAAPLAGYADPLAQPADAPDSLPRQVDRVLLSPASVTGTLITKLQRAGSISGRVVDGGGVSMPGAVVSVESDPVLVPAGVGVAYTDNNGSFRLPAVAAGERILIVSPAGSRRPPGASQPWSRVFYPGTTNREEARTVTIRAGEHASNIEIVFPVRPMHSVRSSLEAPTGVAGVQVRLLAAGGRTLRGLRGDDHGNLGPTEVEAGRYLLWARAGDDTLSLASWQVVDVASDLELPPVSLVPTGTVKGRVVSAAGGLVPVANMRIDSRLVAAGEEYEILGEPGAPVLADGTFELSGMLGARRLVVHGAPPGWDVIDVRIGRSSVLVDVGPASIRDGVEVVLGPRR